MNEKDIAFMQRVSAWYWAFSNELRIKGGQFQLKNHIYQVDWFKEQCKYQVWMKGAQMGVSEVEVIDSLHGQIMGRFPQGVLYLFPNTGDVIDFSKGRFQTMIDNNPCIKRFVADIEAANIKKIGNSILYLRGAKEAHKIEGIKSSSHNLKSTPVDRVVCDEKDEMAEAMVAQAFERLGHSTVKEIRILSTPSIPDWGVDLDYANSDQRVWMLKCPKCNAETCLEIEFPDCLIELNTGEVVRVCKKCKNKIDPQNGRWIARYPSLSKDRVGWWIGQLNSMYVEPKNILNAWLDPRKYNTTKAEVYNSKLGMAYVEAENKLTKNDVYACCTQDAMESFSGRSTAMGVDVGTDLHVVIGYKRDEKRYKIVKVARVSSFEDVHDLAQRHNTKVIVADMEPETRKVRDFKDKHSAQYKVLLCDYQERLKSHEKRDEKQGLLTVRRTETLDMTHETVRDKYLELPRRNDEIEEYAFEMSNIAKILQVDDFTGSRKYNYRGKNDHYFHATNYFILACRDYMIETDMDLAYTYKDDEKQNVYDPYAFLNK